jgi:hypothetical protein
VPLPVGYVEALEWTPERLGHDWPGPIRPEPFLGGPVIEFVPGVDSEWEHTAGRWQGLHHDDHVADVGSGPAWLDIERVGHGGSGPAYLCLHLVGDVPDPAPDPWRRWIAYGFVLDTNGDGKADVRLGMDQTGAGSRAWQTDLATGETSVRAWPPNADLPNAGGPVRIVDWFLPGDTFGDAQWAKLYYAAPGEVMPRAYGWASMIENGRIVATDYAPDVGWLAEPPNPR